MARHDDLRRSIANSIRSIWRSAGARREATRRELSKKSSPGALDENVKTGNRTRLLRFEPGARTVEPFVHDYWEEVYLLSGDLIVGDETKGPRA